MGREDGGLARDCPIRLAAETLTSSSTYPGLPEQPRMALPCVFSSPAEPATSARPSSRCCSKRGIASASLTACKFGGHGLLPCCQNRFFELIKGDVCDEQAVAKALDGIDAVDSPRRHRRLSGLQEGAAGRPDDQRRGHADPARSYASPTRSSSSPPPAASTASIPDYICNEEHPRAPITLYGETKAAGRANDARRRQQRRLPLRHRLRRLEPDAARPDAERLHLSGRQEP